MRSSIQLESLTRRLLELVGELTGLESTYLTAIHWDAGEQEVLYARNVGELEIPEGLRGDWTDTLCRRALQGGPMYTSNVPETYPDSGLAALLGLQTYATVPVKASDGSVLGTLCGVSTSTIELSDPGLKLMRTLGEMVELQLANQQGMDELAVVNAALREQVLTDGLTGVGNRRSLEEYLARSRTASSSSAVVAVDVDHFKSVNDIHGHATGDDVLCAIAERLKTLVRADDLVARIGGDEFVVVLAGASTGRAERIARRLREDIGGALVQTSAGPVAVTVSVGVADCCSQSADELLRLADGALYAAKAKGRNNVAVAGHNVGTTPLSRRLKETKNEACSSSSITVKSHPSP